MIILIQKYKVFIVLKYTIEIANFNLGEVSSYSVLIKTYDTNKEIKIDIENCEKIKINCPLPNNINLCKYKKISN